MDVEKESLADSGLAAGSTMTLVSEQMTMGAISDDKKSKKLQAISEEIGLAADNKLEAQQGDGKAVVKMEGGNVNESADNTQIDSKTTITDDTEVKTQFKSPKGTIDTLEATTSFKSKSITD
jgi:hypothetical protein